MVATAAHFSVGNELEISPFLIEKQGETGISFTLWVGKHESHLLIPALSKRRHSRASSRIESENDDVREQIKQNKQVTLNYVDLSAAFKLYGYGFSQESSIHY